MKEILQTIEEINITLAILTGKQRALKSMVLGVYADTLSKEQYDMLFSKLQTVELEEVKAMLHSISGLVPEKKILQAEFDFFESQKKG